MLIVTEESKNFDSPKKFACNSGLALFERTSGTSQHGKTEVSKIANQNIKKHLLLAALACIKNERQLKNYYERKVAEGRSKMSVINAVWNWLAECLPL